MSLSFEGLEEFIKKLDRAANGDFKKELELWLDALGMEFLDIVQDEIIRTKTVDTRRLLNSFDRGDKENVFTINKGSLSLDVGTNVKYASFVNDGHFTVNPESGRDRRWVPGYWQGDRFIHDRGSKTGMLLTIKWVDGTGYWDNAMAIFEKMFEKSLDNKFQEWLDEYFV